jgi:rubrerythrin
VKAEYLIQPMNYLSYGEGIETALKEELGAAEFYRDVVLNTTDQLVKETFFLAMVDELEHGTIFGVLYNTL